MNKKLFLLGLLLWSGLTTAQDFSWHNDYRMVTTGSYATEVIFSDAIVTASEQQLVVGRWAGTIDLDPTATNSTFTTLSSDLFTNDAWFIQKTDGNGSVLFTRTLMPDDATDQIEIIDAKLKDNGNVVILGVMYGIINANSGYGINMLNGDLDDGNVFLLEYTSAGQLYYLKSFEPNAFDFEPVSLTIFLGTDVQIWARVPFNSVDIDPDVNNVELASSDKLIKLEMTSNGNYAFHAEYPSPGQVKKVQFGEISQIGALGYAIDGLLYNPTQFDPNGSLETPTFGVMNRFVWMQDLNGQYVDHKILLQPNGFSEFRCDLAHGKIFYSGVFQDSLDLDAVSPNYNLQTPTFCRYIAAYDIENGQYIWTKTFSDGGYFDGGYISGANSGDFEDVVYFSNFLMNGHDASGNGTDLMTTSANVISKFSASTGTYNGKMVLPSNVNKAKILARHDENGSQLNLFVSGYTQFVCDLNPGTPVANTEERSAFLAKYSGIGSTNQLTEEELTFSVYPNPAQHELQIEGMESCDCRYVITSLAGERIQSGELLSSHKIDVNNIAPGIYFLALETRSQEGIIKFVKQ